MNFLFNIIIDLGIDYLLCKIFFNKRLNFNLLAVYMYIICNQKFLQYFWHLY